MCFIKILVDSLKHQDEIIINEDIPSNLFNINEEDLIMSHPTKVSGKAYLSDDYLIINYSAKTYFEMPCRICNTFITLPLSLNNIYKTEKYSDIKNKIYDLSSEIRQQLILQLPYFVECNSGDCPSRKNIEKFLKKPSKQKDENYFPFEKIL